VFNSKNIYTLARIFTLIIAGSLLISPSALAKQGRGKGHFKEKKIEKKLDKQRQAEDKKLDKFVNGHDASDGRLDGNGPKGPKGPKGRGKYKK
jgi:hypothetical protein